MCRLGEGGDGNMTDQVRVGEWRETAGEMIIGIGEHCWAMWKPSAEETFRNLRG